MSKDEEIEKRIADDLDEAIDEVLSMYRQGNINKSDARQELKRVFSKTMGRMFRLAWWGCE